MIQKPLYQAACVLRRGLQAQQSRTLVSGPPTQRVSLPEKVAYGAAIGVSLLAVPIWVICHIRSYRDRS